MKLDIEFKQLLDGSWLAKVPQYPGLLATGKNKEDVTRLVTVMVMEKRAEQKCTIKNENS